MSEIDEEISASEAVNRVENGAYLLDVREDYEFSAGHAGAAHHVPLGQIPAALDTLPRDQEIVVVCKAGGRSAQATAFLKENGFTAVNLRGGMLGWEESGLPFQDENGRPGTVV